MLTAAQAWTLQGRREGEKRGRKEAWQKNRDSRRFPQSRDGLGDDYQGDGITPETRQERKATLQEMMTGETELERSLSGSTS